MKHLFLWIILLLLAVNSSSYRKAAANAPSPAATLKLQAAYGNTPLQFEINQGQSDKQVKFLSRGAGHALFLTPTEAVFTLNKPSQRPNAKDIKAFGKRKPSVKVQSEAVRMKLLGANPNPRVVGEDELSGKVNYFIGNDPKKWRTNISTYKKVRYKSVYPGVDLVYYGNQKQLEYDFVVARGADPKAIRLKFAGARHMQVNAQGELVLDLSGGDIRWQLPVVYQNVGGARKMIAGKYVIRDKQRVGFRVASYDHEKPLVIDPVLVYSTYLGGSALEYGRGIAIDSSGHAYITGNTLSPDFPVQNPIQATLKGNGNAFVTKLSADGSAVVYSTYLGGSADDGGSGIAVDANGNAYVSGLTYSHDFPMQNPFQATNHASSNDGANAFVTKLNTGGSALIYSTYLGGSTFDNSDGIAVDSDGNAYIAGSTSSTDFPVQNPFQATLPGIASAFITKFNPSGSGLIYSTYFGGSHGDASGADGKGTEEANGIAVDSNGNAYITGLSVSFDLPLKNPLQGEYSGQTDAFVTKFSVDGGSLIYSTYLGGSGLDQGRGIAVDGDGNVYVTGFTNSTDFPTHDPQQASFGGGAYEGDAFVAKLNPDGSALVYSTYLGGGDNDGGFGIAVDSAGNAWVTGFTYSIDFPIQSPIQAANGGGSNAFISTLNGSGGLTFSTYLGGYGDNEGGGAEHIAVDSGGNAYVIGETLSANFPIKNAFQPTNHGGDDVFIAKIGEPTGAPTGLTATAGDKQVALSWTALPGVTSYNVKRATHSGGPYTTVGGPTTTNYTNTGLTNGHTYYYVVSAVNGAGESANSDEASATPEPPIPATPTGLTVTAGNTQVSLTWTASPGATSYHVKRSTTSGGPYTTISSPAANSATNTGLVNGTTYYYVVSAVNVSGESANSAQASATPEPPVPAAPASLTASPANTQIALLWTASPGATSYNVKRSTTSGGPYATIGSPTAASFTNTGLTNGTAYYYVVSALNVSGESANSAQVSATPGIYPYDFNGDGKPDLAFQNSTSNQVSIWFMNATTVLAAANISPIPASGWKVVGEGDFNGDGRTDLVLQNATLNKAAIWFMSGTALVSGQYISASTPAGWNIAAVGDFNGDGKPDLVLQNAASEKIALWYMNGVTLTAGAYTSVTPSAGWRVAGAGDFNGDGKTDLVLQNATTRQIALWYMNGAAVTGGAYVSTVPSSGWQVAGVGDFNGDHKPDLVLQNATSRQVAFWYMNGAALAGGAYASATPVSGWQVVAPR